MTDTIERLVSEVENRLEILAAQPDEEERRAALTEIARELSELRDDDGTDTE